MFTIYFEDKFFNDLIEFFGNFSSNIDEYTVKIFWILLFFGVLSVFWAFFLRINRNIKTGELISRLIISFSLFFILWFLTKILDIDLISN